jgi:hypothetical protein
MTDHYGQHIQGCVSCYRYVEACENRPEDVFYAHSIRRIPIRIRIAGQIIAQ